MANSRSGRQKRNSVAGDAAAAVILLVICLALGAGIADFYLDGMSRKEVSVSVNKNFVANAETYSSNYTASSSRIIEAGSGAVVQSSKNDGTYGYGYLYVTATPVPELPAADFMFPKSSREVLTDEDLAKLTDFNSCQRAINEIYARHGYEFNYDLDPEDYEYFNSLGWYAEMPKKNESDVMAELDYEEYTNVALINNYRAIMGW